ncbi:hypothetical protein ABZX51_011559 [Aspergillus tubingensis]
MVKDNASILTNGPTYYTSKSCGSRKGTTTDSVALDFPGYTVYRKGKGPGLRTIAYDQLTSRLSINSRIDGYWVNFIKNGNPNGEGLTYWPPSKENPTTTWLGDSWGAGKVAEPARIDLIRSWFGQNVEW